MKTTTKVIIGLIFVIIAMAAAGVYIYQKSTKSKEKKSPIEALKKKEIETEAAEIAREVKANGIEHVVYRMKKEIDHNALDKARSELLDTIAELNIARDKIKQVVSISTTLRIDNQELERKITDLATTYSHNDANASLSVNVPRDSSQSATFNWKYNALLTDVQYYKRKWLLGNNELYIDIFPNDKRVTINGAKTLTIKPKGSQFGAQVKAITEYNISQSSFAAGPAIGIDAGRTTFQGKYLYDPNRNKWNWIISAGLNVDIF